MQTQHNQLNAHVKHIKTRLDCHRVAMPLPKHKFHVRSLCDHWFGWMNDKKHQEMETMLKQKKEE